MKILLVLPLVIPLGTAVVCLLAWRWRGAQRAVSAVGSAALVAAAIALVLQVWRQGIQAVQMGDWPAPFGITLVGDLFSAAMVLVAALIGFTGIVYSLGSMDRRREAYGYHPLMHLLLLGVCGAFLTGDIFNLYVWFEVMLISSFVLMVLGGERAQMEGAIKYVTLNLLSSALFLAAVGILYGAVGTLNMADVALRLEQTSHTGLTSTLAVLFLVAFGIKAAIFPLFFWLPASYHTPPAAVSAVFAGLLTKVGVYAVIRVFTLLFVQDVDFTHRLILILSGLTMATGVLGAVSQNEFRRVLSFHIISQIGYMTMGLGLYTPLGVAGSIFYIIHHIIVKTNLFLVSGLVRRLQGSYELKYLGGLYRRHPGLAVLFLIPALSLAGMPPLSGFFAKLSLVMAGLAIQEYAIVATALAVGILTLFSMIKIWTEAFWKPQPPSAAELQPAEKLDEEHPEGRTLYMVLPIVLLAGITLMLGIAGEPFFQYALRAGEQLLDKREYIEAVLGAARPPEAAP